MAKRALQKARYLTGKESEEELKSDLLYEVAADFVTDVLYLIQSSTGTKPDSNAVAKLSVRVEEALRNDAALGRR
jgi:N-acetylglucosamine kinase-like BadF-type ATPase